MHWNRASIAGLMGVVAVVAVSLTALRSASPVWTSLAFLLTCGVLACALIGALCAPAEHRAWWIGCSVFGWGYLALSCWEGSWFHVHYPRPELPTSGVLRRIVMGLGGRSAPPRTIVSEGGFIGMEDDNYGEYLDHCLWSLLFAIVGGIVASRIIAVPEGPPVRAVDAAPRVRCASPWWRRGTTLLGLSGLAVFLASGLAWSRTAPGVWAGLTLMMTWGLLGLLALGAGFRTGPSRPRWLGAAVFGAGYLWLVPGSYEDPTWPQSATTHLIYAIQPWVPWIGTDHPSGSPTIAEINTRIVRTLDRRIPMRFPNDTPLETFVAYLKDATRDPDGWTVPIYVDPVGLQEAEKTMQSPVALVVEGAPLRTTLELALRQLGLVSIVERGVLKITNMTTGPWDDDRFYTAPILVLGQCVLTWLAAGLGGLLAPLACGGNRGPEVTA